MRHPTELVLATVFDLATVKQSQFLYTIYGILENQATLYIGQTRGKTGPLGRLTQHLSDGDNNTYLQRLSDVYHYEKVLLEKVDFVAIQFTPSRLFQIDSPVYRQAVEGLVQSSLLNWIHKQKLKIAIVSRVSSNAYRKHQCVREEADRISSLLESRILRFHR